jgi:hypothetical protein
LLDEQAAQQAVMDDLDVFFSGQPIPGVVSCDDPITFRVVEANRAAGGIIQRWHSPMCE